MNRSAIAASIAIASALAAVRPAAALPGSIQEGCRAIELVNLQRAQRGLAPLKAQDNLIEAAAAHARDMADNGYFSHTGRTGSSPWDRARTAGYAGCRAENIFASGRGAGAQGAVKAWMQSAGHRAAILDPQNLETGAAVARSASGREVWVQMFGARDGVWPVVIENEAWSTGSSTVHVYVHGEGQARQMCTSQNGKLYTRWEPYRSRIEWTFEQGDGRQTAYIVTKDEQGRLHFANDSIIVGDGGEAADAQPAATATAAAPASTGGVLPALPGAPSVAGSGATHGAGDALPAAPPASGAVYGGGERSVSMVFPVVGKCTWHDTFGAPRDGGRRQHHGQDISAPKMRPLVAAFAGRAFFTRTDRPFAHNTLTLRGDNGWTAVYMHINNDTPGTNDGRGSKLHAFADGLQSGDHVDAGQCIAFLGNSGNAETTGPHLHFELLSPSGLVNARASLASARRIDHPPVQMARRSSASRLASVPRGAVTPPIAPMPVEATREIRSDSPAARSFEPDQVAEAAVVVPPSRGRRADGVQIASRSGSRVRQQSAAAADAEIDAQDAASEAARLLELINLIRLRYSLPALQLDDRLASAAARHARDMGRRGFCSHMGSDRTSVVERVAAAGYPAAECGQAIDDRSELAQDALDSWIGRSLVASQAILNRRCTRIGIAHILGKVRDGEEARRHYRVLVVAAAAQGE